MNREPLWPPTIPRRETLIRWAPVLAIVAACLALGLGEDALRQWGRYDRGALASGELWRLVTAHLVHLSWGHLWLNLAALVMMAANKPMITTTTMISISVNPRWDRPTVDPAADMCLPLFNPCGRRLEDSTNVLRYQ